MATIENIIVIAVTMICAFLAVKLHNTYKKTDDLKYIVLLSIVLLALTDAWISFYGQNVKAFFDKYRFLFTFIPLAIYFLYSYIDTKRRREQQEKEKIKNAFKQYVMPAIIDELLRDPSKLKLGGEKKHLSILFTDIKDFSTISEHLSPEQLVGFLNEYLTKMTDIILENHGVVDKYIGDAIMAFWGAPVDEPYHTYLVCKSALDMVEINKKMNVEWKERGLPEIHTRIGINTGNVIVGNIGSEKKFDYTVLGDHVNLASRLEGLNKMYGTHVLISESTYQLVKDRVNVRSLDLVRVKGKTQPVKIYELLPEKLSKEDKEFLRIWDKALELYCTRKFGDAKKWFESCLKIKAEKAAEEYAERCRTFLKTPPPKDWDCVWTHTTK